jgi:oligoendopeptidase F
MPSPAAVPARSDVPAEHRWNAESVFASPEAWQEAFTAAAARLPELKAFEGRLGEGPGVLADFFALTESITRQVGHVYFYAVMTQAWVITA